MGDVQETPKEGQTLMEFALSSNRYDIAEWLINCAHSRLTGPHISADDRRQEMSELLKKLRTEEKRNRLKKKGRPSDEKSVKIVLGGETPAGRIPAIPPSEPPKPTS